MRLSRRNCHTLGELGQVGIAASFLGGGQVVKGAVIGPALHIDALQLPQHLVRTTQHVQCSLREIKDLVPLAHLGIGQVRANGSCDVAGERPGGGSPDQQRFGQATRSAPTTVRCPQWEPQGDGVMGQLGVAIGDDLMLADAGGAARAPGHYVGAAIQPALLPTLLNEGPDHVVVLI